jgi:hypothetical protein
MNREKQYPNDHQNWEINTTAVRETPLQWNNFLDRRHDGAVMKKINEIIKAK